jgi:hypothetical protein
MLRLDCLDRGDHRVLGGHVQCQRATTERFQIGKCLNLPGCGVDDEPGADQCCSSGGADAR